MMTDKIINHIASATGPQLLRCGRDSVQPSPDTLYTLTVRSSSVLFEIE
jgi:hypothetical protein